VTIAHGNLDVRFLLQGRAWESLVSFFEGAPDSLNLPGNHGVQVVYHETVEFSVLQLSPAVSRQRQGLFAIVFGQLSEGYGQQLGAAKVREIKAVSKLNYRSDNDSLSTCPSTRSFGGMLPEINPMTQPIELVLTRSPFVHSNFPKEESPGKFRGLARFGPMVSQNDPRESFQAGYPRIGWLHCP
jgi:hypothetical protein